MPAILGISGSLHQGSFNTELLRAAGEMVDEKLKAQLQQFLHGFVAFLQR